MGATTRGERPQDRRRNPRVATAAIVAGDAVLFVGTLLPFIRSGGATRNSYSMIRSAELLDVVHNGYGRSIVRGWYFVPVVAALIALLLLLHRRRTAAALGLLLAAGSTVLGIVTLITPLRAPAGPLVTLVGATALATGSIIVLRGTALGGPPEGNDESAAEESTPM